MQEALPPGLDFSSAKLDFSSTFQDSFFFFFFFNLVGLLADYTDRKIRTLWENCREKQIEFPKTKKKKPNPDFWEFQIQTKIKSLQICSDTTWWIPYEEILLSLILLKEDLVVWERKWLISVMMDGLNGWSSEMIYVMIKSCVELSRSREWTLFLIKDRLLAENELLAIYVQGWTKDSQI